MTLGDYYKGKKWQDDDNVFMRQKRQIYGVLQNRFGSEKRDLQPLEKYLNSLYYPDPEKGDDMNKAKRFAEIVQKAYEQIILEKLNNFAFGQDLEILRENSNLMVREKYESFKHKNYIEKQTLETRLTKVKKKIKELKQSGNSTQDIQDIIKELKILQKQLQNIFKEYKGSFGETGGTNNKTVLKLENDNMINAIDEIDSAYKALSIASVSPTDYGDIFELSLGLASAELIQHLEDETITDLIVNEFKNRKSNVYTGKQHVSRDNIFSIETVLDYSEDDKKGMTMTKDKLTTTMEFGNLKIASKPGGSRAGKLDISFTLPDAPQQRPFRVSAKNWGSVNNFGDTELWYALSRTVDANTVQHLMYRLGNNKSNTSTLQAAHDLIEFSIIVDGLVGYSQQNNWVDTLIINYRPLPKIIVESIPELVEAAYSKLNQRIITNYNGDKIRQSALKFYEGIKYKKKDRSTIFKMNMIDLLINTMVHAKYVLPNSNEEK